MAARGSVFHWFLVLGMVSNFGCTSASLCTVLFISIVAITACFLLFAVSSNLFLSQPIISDFSSDGGRWWGKWLHGFLFSGTTKLKSAIPNQEH